MITIKHINSNITATPMPSNQGLFSDATLPNCPATHCCLIRAASTSTLRSKISIPALTEEEVQLAIDLQLDNKDDWDITFEASEEEIKSLKAEKVGYTIEEADAYVKSENEKLKEAYIEDGNNPSTFEPKVFLESEIHGALGKRESDSSGITFTLVEIPSEEKLTQEIVEAKELSYAKSLVDQLIANGYLVTDLDAVDEDNNEIYGEWKAQFEIIETEEG